MLTQCLQNSAESGGQCLNTKFPLPTLLNAGYSVEWRNSTPRFASTPERRNGNINLNKIFLEWGSNPQPAASAVTLRPCATTSLLDI